MRTDIRTQENGIINRVILTVISSVADTAYRNERFASMGRGQMFALKRMA
jgi:hypothetical protein